MPSSDDSLGGRRKIKSNISCDLMGQEFWNCLQSGSGLSEPQACTTQDPFELHLIDIENSAEVLIPVQFVRHSTASEALLLLSQSRCVSL